MANRMPSEQGMSSQSSRVLVVRVMKLHESQPHFFIGSLHLHLRMSKAPPNHNLAIHHCIHS